MFAQQSILVDALLTQVYNSGSGKNENFVNGNLK